MAKKIPLSHDAFVIYKRLLRYVRPHRKAFALGVLGMGLFALCESAWAWFTKQFLDGTFVNHDPTMVWKVPIGLIGLFLVRGIAEFTKTYYPGYVGRQIIKRIRTQIFDRYLHLPVAYFDRSPSGALLSKLIYNTEQVSQAVTDSVTSFIQDTLIIIALVTYAFYLNARLAVIAFMVVPLIGWLISLVNKLFRRYSQRIQNSMGDVTRIAKEAIESPRVIKAFNAQSYQAALFEEVNEHNRRSFMKLLLTRGLSNPVIGLLASSGLSVVLYVVMVDAVRGQLTVGSFTAFIGSLVLIRPALGRLVNVAGPLQQGIAAAQGIFELLDTPVESSRGHAQVTRVRGEVEFRDVSFEYQSDKGPALNHINLNVRAGETIAIVGRSGSGKSTLVNLVPRFYDVMDGAVLIDSVDARDYDLNNLRSHISLVSQEVVLFNDSIRNNIAFGYSASDEAIAEAARAAHVTEFTRDLPEGLNTEVGDRGMLLSGGQRQRIAIARALLRNTPILILDEATSALDTESERAIQGALEELMHNRTTLVIAHRLSTIENADRIVVMNAGHIIEIGTHTELLAKDGHYAALHRMQFND